MTVSAVSIERNILGCLLQDAGDPTETGHKAYNLGRMMRLGMNVPQGFVLKNHAFRQFLLAGELAAQVSDIEKNCAADFRAASATIRRLVHSVGVPEDIVECILEMRHSCLGDAQLIVRSSAVGEDGGAASFAGQLDSIAGIQTPVQIERALLECWSSYWNERVLFYQKAKGIPLRGMGVIFQIQVAARFSGVLFTQAPGCANPGGRLYAEYCAGSGEALVSGRVTPGRFEISRQDYRCASIQLFQTDAKAEEPFPLTSNHVQHLGQSAVMLESEFGSAQDIEWSIDEAGALYLLQSRPITTAGAASSTVLWSNSNVNENFPDAITPFLYSIAREGYYHYFRNLAIAFGVAQRRVHRMEQSFRHIIGVHHSRMYYNLTSIHSVLREAPFGEALARFFNQFIGATELAPRRERHEVSPWRQVIEVITIGIKTLRQYIFFSRRIEKFEEQAERFAQSTRPQELPHRPLIDLRDDLRRFMEIRCHRWTNASLADAAAMVTYGLLQCFLRKAYPDDTDSAGHNNLLKGLNGIASVRPTIQLWEISRQMLRDPELVERFRNTNSLQIRSEILEQPEYDWLRRAIEEYLEQWGYRFSGELMLTVPSFQENQPPLYDLLKTYLLAEGPSPPEAIDRLEGERVAETRRILVDLRHNRRLPFVPRALQAVALRILLRATRRAIQMRERARSKQALLYSRCRRLALAIGNQLSAEGFLEEADDVFFLAYEELDDFLSGYAMFPFALKPQVALRKESHAGARALRAPDSFALPDGGYWRAPLPDPDATQPDGELRGIGACGGRVSAPAAVLGSVDEAHLLRQGDILVTRQTDPGWGPVFFLIRGLVIERGGMLSHGAIIAREFGLPCVVGVKDATTRIDQGCVVTVDGDRGYVQILD